MAAVKQWARNGGPLQCTGFFTDFRGIPGGITAETDVDCPHCGMSLTVAVDDPDGEQACACGVCSGEFVIDCADGTMRWPG